MGSAPVFTNTGSTVVPYPYAMAYNINNYDVSAFRASMDCYYTPLSDCSAEVWLYAFMNDAYPLPFGGFDGFADGWTAYEYNAVTNYTRTSGATVEPSVRLGPAGDLSIPTNSTDTASYSVGWVPLDWRALHKHNAPTNGFRWFR